jgi:ubiquinone/menaquinone biosynthesis C-methylase UbiE
LGRWSVRRGLDFDGVGLDLGRHTLRIAASYLHESGAGSVRLVRADARSLPFPDRRFDVTVCSTFLHHLDQAEAVGALREMARVSDLGLVVSDLRRGRPGYMAAWLLANTLWRRHRYTRHDAEVSMLAAYTLGEARKIAQRAGLRAEVEPQLWFRWALRWRRPL